MIDMDLIKYLTREQAERMRAFEQLLGSPGWKFLMESVEQQYESAKLGALAATSWPDNRIQIGRMHVLGELLNFEKTVINELETAAEAAKQNAELEEMDVEFEYE